MISVVIYGRNDSYGYNLHKRAAISINCIAEILSDAADEILFVDYNSPDDVPTFPEAIQDTLTEKAKERLRILRVRGKVHERFRKKTQLEAIEPVARNVAVRRSNPENRWVLSTNTDIILVPRSKANLSEVVAGLPHGLYHVPRFEVPESLWETFDRTDPRQTIADVRALGVAARLNEVVLSDVILYDGPGDFQLIERADLFAIDGFDEEMILGWHVDSNIAKRLILKHGGVSSLLGEVFCYHCDHTRLASPVHGAERIENDWRRFVEDVEGPELPSQRDHWGCRDDAVEEIRLSANGVHPYRDVLRSVVAPLPQEFTETAFTPRSFDSYDYDPGHVLPFLADLLNSYHRDMSAAWFGVRADMFSLFCQAWQGLGFRRPIMIDQANSAVLGGSTAGNWRLVSRRNWPRSADLLLFEFGRNGSGDNLARADIEALQAVRAAFLDAVAAERSRLSEEAAPRRFIGINCVHNSMEGLFTARIGITQTPFSTHLRHGFLRRPAAAAAGGTDLAALAIGEVLGRQGEITRKEFGLARYLFGPLLEGGEIPPALRHRAGIHAMLGQAFVQVVGNPHRASPPPPVVARALDAIEAMRPSAGFAAPPGVVVAEMRGTTAEDRPLSRFAAYEDWDDPLWARFLDTESEAFLRGGPAWERVHLLYGLERLWKFGELSHVLIAASMPDPVIGELAERVGHIDLFEMTAAPTPRRSPEEAWRHYIEASVRAPFAPGRHRILDTGAGLAGLHRDAYDAVVFPHGSLFGGGCEAAIGLIEAAESLLKPDGVIVFKAEIAADDLPNADFFDAGFTVEDGFAAQLAKVTGLVADGGFDARLSRATLDKMEPEAGPSAGEVYFLSRNGDRLLIPSLWFLRKRRPTPAGGWDRLRRWLAARFFGEQIGRLQVGPAGERREGGAIAVLPGIDGHVFYGPYLPFPSGRYRLSGKVEGAEDPSPLRLAIEVVADSLAFADLAIEGDRLCSGVFATEFELPPHGDDAPAYVIEIRAYSPGDAEAVFTTIDVSPAEAEPAAPALRAFVEPELETGPILETFENEPLDLEIDEEEPTPARPISRIASDRDWDDPAWSRFLPRSMPRDPQSWRHAHLLYGLDRAGKLTLTTRIAVLATRPDALIGTLSERVGRIDVLDLLGDDSRVGAEGRLYWSEGVFYSRNRLRILHRRGAAGLQPEAYDAVVFPHDSLFAGGWPGVAGLLEMADGVLQEGGLIVFQADLKARVTLGEVQALVEQLAACTGLSLEEGFDPASHQEDHSNPAPSLWFLRKRAAAGEAEWRRIEDWAASRSLGEQIGHLQIGPAGRRDDSGLSIATLPGRKGHVFYGPYLSLARGVYEATLALEPRPSGGGNLSLEIVAGEKRFAQQRVALRDGGPRRLSLRFEIPAPPHAGAPGKVEIRAWSDGADAVFHECRIDRLAAGP